MVSKVKQKLELSGLNGFLVVLVFTCYSVLSSSCITYSKVEFFQDLSESIKTFDDVDFNDYRLKPNDELYININSLDEGTVNVFSNISGQLQSLDPYSASLLSYSIDKDGYLLLPVIGSILVKDKTLSQVSGILKDSLTHILNQPIITVKLVNRYVSVLGEVTNPGHFSYPQEKLSIFEAIGLAGDITDFANPGNVTIIRNEDGQNIIAKLNLANSDILNSGFYYLRPNDIIYIQSLRRNKFWQLRQVPLSLLLSAITTGLLIYQIAGGN